MARQVRDLARGVSNRRTPRRDNSHMELTADLASLFWPASVAAPGAAPAVRRGLSGTMAVGAGAMIVASGLSLQTGALGYGWHLLVATTALVTMMIVAHDAIHA